MKIVIYDDEEQEIASMELFEGEEKPHRKAYMGSEVTSDVKIYCLVEMFPLTGKVTRSPIGTPKD